MQKQGKLQVSQGQHPARARLTEQRETRLLNPSETSWESSDPGAASPALLSALSLSFLLMKGWSKTLLLTLL